MDELSFLIGALGPTLLLSRLALWLMRRRNAELQNLFLAHIISLLICKLVAALGMLNGVSVLKYTIIGAMGIANDPMLAALQAFLAYIIPQMVWLAVDLWRHWSGLPPLLVRVRVNKGARALNK